jgi:hypothetical protein
MSHLSEDELILLHYGEPAAPGAAEHVAGCAECTERLRALGELLSRVVAPDAPERGADYGARVFERLRPVLGQDDARPRVVAFRKRRWRSLVAVGALAASLVLAFLLGRRFPAEPLALSAEARERVLLVAVGEHLERSQLVLVELANAPAGEALNVKTQRALADELVPANRLYRQAAVRSGEPALAGVLDELERVLVEVAAGPDALAPLDLAELQRRIDSRGLLFRVRVIGSQVREREKDLVPRPAISS